MKTESDIHAADRAAADPRTADTPDTDVSRSVKERYAAAARAVLERSDRAGCGCGCDDRGPSADDVITRDLYDPDSTEGIPEDALLASLGCGNPTALAELREGETVLDLGSGGGIDVLLSARRVGPEGRAYGLDQSPEMLELARRNAERAGAANVEFLEGGIEDIPLPDDSVDVVISNCVINLSGNKPRVLAEAFRVLKPGGRFAVSDIVARGAMPAEIRRSLELWSGCIAGAMVDTEFESLLREVGFVETEIEPTREYGLDDAREALRSAGVDADGLAGELQGRLVSAFVRARKPEPADSGGEPVRRG